MIGAGALLLAGCASGSTAGVTPSGSGSAAAPAASGSELELEAGWLDGGRQIGLVTWGSSTCVPMAGDVALQADGSVAVTLQAIDAATVCTADYAPRVTLVPVPEGVDPTKDLDLVVTDANGARGETDLDGVAGLAAGGQTDYAPSAGWAGDDLIAILTWGSSSCAPRVQDVAAADATHVTVTFADLADKACTMDMAPRATLAAVSGLDVDDTGASLTLSGGDAQFATPVTVPIVG
ncbi:hypothetical protein J0P97_09910 [Microbacterium flavum]|uniref:Uncharacterized protein n=1 Tax=Microbacterium flavum TaxID=415216 RepID=A0ABS5XV35_9MICO|nr:hypothetical protein [Microbacterium flavum]